MIGKILTLLAVPLGFIAYSTYAKASPKSRPSFEVKGKSGLPWRVERVSQFQQPDGMLTMNDIFSRSSGGGEERVMRYSQLGSAISTRKYVTSPFEVGSSKTPGLGRLLGQAATDFGIVLPATLAAKLKANPTL